ncbi:MAG: hypothetical protein E7Z96_09640 [Actinomycetaceae bacterium]|nr:hypothetical protein [Actinomycetaceae bacterium]
MTGRGAAGDGDRMWIADEVAEAVGELDDPPEWRVSFLSFQWLMILVCPAAAVILPGGPGRGGWVAALTLMLLVPGMLIAQIGAGVLTGIATRFFHPTRVFARTASIMRLYYISVMVTALCAPDLDDYQEYLSIVGSLLRLLRLPTFVWEGVPGVVYLCGMLATPCLMLGVLFSALSDWSRVRDAAYWSQHDESWAQSTRQDHVPASQTSSRVDHAGGSAAAADASVTEVPCATEVPTDASDSADPASDSSAGGADGLEHGPQDGWRDGEL